MPILIVRGDWDGFEDEGEERKEWIVARLMEEIEQAIRELKAAGVVYVDGEPCVEFPAPSLPNLSN